MKKLHLLRYTFSLTLLLSSVSAVSAQTLTREETLPQQAKAPEPAAADQTWTQQRAELVRTLTNRLQLQPHQVLLLNRSLASVEEVSATGSIIPPFATESDMLVRLALTEAQRVRLHEWGKTASARQLSFVALVQ